MKCYSLLHREARPRNLCVPDLLAMELRFRWDVTGSDHWARASRSLHLWCHTALSHTANWQQPLAAHMHAAHLHLLHFQENITL